MRTLNLHCAFGYGGGEGDSCDGVWVHRLRGDVRRTSAHGSRVRRAQRRLRLVLLRGVRLLLPLDIRGLLVR